MRIFISYRRDDTGGYAGRLEESLERRLGRGTVFRDVGDIAPGDDFVRTIRQRLATADGVLVLIGPRWAGAGEDGRRRLDEEGDFVRLEVAEALASPARVVPVLLRGATMPLEDELPAPLKPLALRHALPLDELHWDAGIARLLDGLGARPRRAAWRWALGGVLAGGSVAALGTAAWCGLLPGIGRPADPAAAFIGTWEATVRYDWGDTHLERFTFEQHAGALTGTASFLRYPRAIENVRVEDGHLHFETRSVQTMGSEEREQLRRYAAELRHTPDGPVLAFRMSAHGGFGNPPPLSFEARRVTAGDGPAAGPVNPGPAR